MRAGRKARVEMEASANGSAETSESVSGAATTGPVRVLVQSAASGFVSVDCADCEGACEAERCVSCADADRNAWAVRRAFSGSLEMDWICWPVACAI